jgi:hypothetical protein
MNLLTRRGFLLAVALGALSGVLLWRWRGDPCGALSRRYAATYEALRGCDADADCLVDPPAVHGPALCDRSRTRDGERDRLVAIERDFEARGCEPGKTSPCGEPLGARCDRGRCVALR